MTVDESLAARIRTVLAGKTAVEEKKLFGCVCFLVKGNVLVGVWKGSLIARLGPDEGELALREPYVRPFDITGKPMTGWVVVDPAGVEAEADLKRWVKQASMFVKTLPSK